MAARKTKLNNFQSRKELQKLSDRDNTCNLQECNCDATTPAPLHDQLSVVHWVVVLAEFNCIYNIYIQMTFLR